MLDLNFEDIDFYNIATWPAYLKAGVVIGAGLIIYFICNWLFIEGKLESLESLKAEETRLKNFFVGKQNQLINIDDYREQYEVIEKRLAKLTKKLPEANELPNLINQISQAGQASGLSFKEIKILPEKKFSYYVELPIKITAEGDYHKIGDFVSKVSSMPRVITFHDFKLDRVNKSPESGNDSNLKFEVLAKTYRYLHNTVEKDDKESDTAGVKEEQ